MGCRRSILWGTGPNIGVPYRVPFRLRLNVFGVPKGRYRAKFGEMNSTLAYRVNFRADHAPIHAGVRTYS